MARDGTSGTPDSFDPVFKDDSRTPSPFLSPDRPVMKPPARRSLCAVRLARRVRRACARPALLVACAAAALAPAAAAQFSGGKAIGVAPVMTQTEGGGQRWALVVGINDYSSVPGLRFARQDAQAMARALVEHCGFPKDNVVLMTDDRAVRVDAPHLYPTRSNLRNRINRIAEIAGKDDVLLIFYSGHGVNLLGEAHLVPVDGNDRDPGSLVPLRWVTSTVESSSATQRMLILDACHAGAKSGGPDSPAERINATMAAAAFQTLASCGPQELSHEDPDSGHGVFATALLEGLEGAADAEGEGNRDGSITADELFDYASLRVKRWSFATGKRQTPVLKGQRRGPVTIARSSRPPAPDPTPEPEPVEAVVPTVEALVPPAEPAVQVPQRPKTDTTPTPDPEPAADAPRPVAPKPPPPMETPVPRYAPRPGADDADHDHDEADDDRNDSDAADRIATRFDPGPVPPAVAPAPPAPEPAFAFAAVAADRLTMALISGPSDPLAPTAVLTVAADGGGQYREIAEAVAAAPPGALVLVAPGHYSEKVTVDKAIEVRGAGPLGTAVLTAGNGHALRLTADHAVVRNLAVVGVGKLWGDTEALLIERGTPWIIGCDVASKSHACVQVQGDAKPVLVGCTVRNGATTGVYAEDHADVRIEGGLIYGHAKYGVELRGKARLTLRHAAVYDNRKSGLYFHEKTAGTVVACEVYGNAHSGIAVTENAEAAVTHSTVRHNGKRGVLVASKAAVSFDRCRVYRNAGPGVELKDRAAPEFLRTAVVENQGPGVCRRDAKVGGRFLGVEIRGNAGGAVNQPEGEEDLLELPDHPAPSVPRP